MRWPLHSPLRLLGVIAGLIAAIMVLGAINDRGAGAEPTAVRTPTATPTADVQDEPSPTPVPAAAPAGAPDETDNGAGTAGATDAFSVDPTGADAALAAQVAADFVAAWARPDLDAASWQAGLAPHTTPQLMALLGDTDPANVPAVTVSGQPVEVAANAEAGVYDVPTTGDFVRVHVQLIDGTWLATDVEPAA
ncbi:hypothetical protein [uncultured Cellulomonas sp.]|uniref:hypothetical protein n=1 Tax=uncultured Cellulomonas sp. TaxID=189682 RepID=UPI0026134F7C|nr:hypothetical protein [uncultured Cellulomonas sp.]